jgi:hypothetical protein
MNSGAIDAPRASSKTFRYELQSNGLQGEEKHPRQKRRV